MGKKRGNLYTALFGALELSFSRGRDWHFCEFVWMHVDMCVCTLTDFHIVTQMAKVNKGPGVTGYF